MNTYLITEYAFGSEYVFFDINKKYYSLDIIAKKDMSINIK